MKLHSSVQAAASLVAALAIIACGNREVGTDPGSSALEVIVNTPVARAGAVAIHGPTVHSSYVTSTDTLRGLLPGQYVARADLVAASDSLVSSVLTGIVTGSPVMVEAGQMSSVTATYAIRGGSGAMWVGKWGHVNLAEGFTSAQLATAGTATPTDTIGASADSLTISGTAFDSAGNMWVTDYINQKILKFTPAQMASGGSTATVVVTTAKEPWGIAFDTHGNLWVAYYNGNYVHEYAVSAVQSWSGALSNPVPALTIDSQNGPLGLAFDHDGNLWVAGFDNPVTYRTTASAIAGASSGTIEPTDSLVSPYLIQGSGLAFDRGGNLWEATEAGYIVSYLANQLGNPSHATPDFASLSPAYSFDEIAFDNSGNLWAATESADVAMFGPASLTSGDLSVPTRTLTSGSSEASFGLGFNTHDGALPISPAFSIRGGSARQLAAPPRVQSGNGSRPGTVRRR